MFKVHLPKFSSLLLRPPLSPVNHASRLHQSTLTRANRATVLSPVPIAEPISWRDLQFLESFFQDNSRVTVLTGAGVSTESNVPDYRGPKGAYSTGFKPMTHQQFLASEENRSRYWARSYIGWHEFSSVQPSAAHHAIARLQERGYVSNLITQNVDRLHQKAGARGVVELHGTTHEVVCLHCGAVSCRHQLQERLTELNPELAALARRIQEGSSDRARLQRALKIGTAADARAMRGGEHSGDPMQLKSWQTADLGVVPSNEAASSPSSSPSTSASTLSQRIEIMRPSLAPPSRTLHASPQPQQEAEEGEVGVQRPDGDQEISARLAASFKVPPCSSCGTGTLKPHVVFFGDSLPAERKDRAAQMVRESDALLCVGTSLMVFSAFRLAQLARDQGKPLVILTVGETRADHVATKKLEYVAGETLQRLSMLPSLQIPRF